MFPHRAWPYPRGEREIRRVILVTLAIVFITLIGIVAGLKYEDEKMLAQQDIYFAAKNMASYSNEAYLIATKSQDQPLVGPYRQVYIEQLASDVSKVKDKLATHDSKGNVHSRSTHLAELCDRLNDILHTLMRDPTDQTFTTHSKDLKMLAKEAKSIENSL